jgi:hypothetical protein
MTIFEILKFNREIIERLHKAGVRHSDVRYIDLYSDYSTLVAQGAKASYAAAEAASRHGVSIRKTYDVISRFKNDCTFCTG